MARTLSQIWYLDHAIMPRSPRSPRSPRYNVALALSELAAADPELGLLVARAGPFTLRLGSQETPFEALVESIIYQQLHGKAAAAIHGRLLASFASLAALDEHPSPEELLECPNEQLRAAGLSRNKILALRDLAAKTLDGTVPTLGRIRRMSDEAIVEHLTQVRGIGAWTVHMMLIFRLGRPDILPTGDYGVRRGFALTFLGLKPGVRVTTTDLPSPAQMQERATRWKPWRSVASWYLWRACDLADKKLSET